MFLSEAPRAGGEATTAYVSERPQDVRFNGYLVLRDYLAMRRLSRLLDSLGSPAGLPVLAALLEKPQGQDALRDILGQHEIPVTSATLSALMIRFEDMGLVDRDNRKAPYRLRHREEVSAALLHLAALGVELAASEGAEAEALEALSHRARLRMVEVHDNEEGIERP